MIRAAPMIDFVGSLQVKTLEIGTIHLNTKPTPAIRIKLQQSQSVYPILASSHLAGEVYAYCVAADEQDILEMDSKVSGSLVIDDMQRLHVVASNVTWFTSSILRERAAAKIVHILDHGQAETKFIRCEEPFASFQADPGIVR